MVQSGKQGKLIFVWCHPRGRTTAFMRCLTNRPNTVGYFEPFSFIFYSGPDSPLKDHPVAQSFFPTDLESTFEKVLAKIQKDVSEGKDVIVKDFTWFMYKFTQFIPLEAKHIFLVRDPTYVGFSTLNIVGKVAPEAAKALLDFSNQAYVGNGLLYSSLVDVHKYLKENGHEPLVLDTQDLLMKPKETMEKVCQYSDLTFNEAMLSWTPLKEFQYPENWTVPSAFRQYDGIFNWVGAALNSNGLIKSEKGETNKEVLPYDIVPPEMMANLQVLVAPYTQIMQYVTKI